MKYKVESGSMKKIIEAKNINEACKKAYKEHKGDLGLLTSILKVGDDEENTLYTSTIEQLKKFKMFEK